MNNKNPIGFPKLILHRYPCIIFFKYFNMMQTEEGLTNNNKRKTSIQIIENLYRNILKVKIHKHQFGIQNIMREKNLVHLKNKKRL